jgi:hypothetical protein
MLKDQDRIFTNLYGFHSPGLEAASAARGTAPRLIIDAAATGSSTR